MEFKSGAKNVMGLVLVIKAWRKMFLCKYSWGVTVARLRKIRKIFGNEYRYIWVKSVLFQKVLKYYYFILQHPSLVITAQKMKFSIKDFFSKCDQIRSLLRIWSNLLKKSLMENFIFCAVDSRTFRETATFQQ